MINYTMNIKVKEDIKSISVFRTDPASVLRQIRENQRPVVITERGKPSAVIVDLEDYERQKEKMDLMEAVLEGEKDFREGRFSDLDTFFRESHRWLAKK